MFAKAGIEVHKGEDGKPVAIGVALKQPQSRALVPASAV
jgi:hypothetical protein